MYQLQQQQQDLQETRERADTESVTGTRHMAATRTAPHFLIPHIPPNLQ